MGTSEWIAVIVALCAVVAAGMAVARFRRVAAASLEAHGDGAVIEDPALLPQPTVTSFPVQTAEGDPALWQIEVSRGEETDLEPGDWVTAPSDLAAHIVKTLPELATRVELRSDSLVRIVNGTSKDLAPASDGTLHAWRRGADGKITRPARLQRTAAPALVSPALVWAAASVIVGAHWQRQIADQLTTIHAAVAGIRNALDTARAAEIEDAADRLRELAAARAAPLEHLLEEDPTLARARTAFLTQLALLEAKFAAAPHRTRDGQVRFDAYRSWVGGQTGNPGVLSLYAAALRGYAVVGAHHRLREEAHRATGQADRAAQVQRTADEHRDRMRAATEGLDALLDHPIRFPLDVPRGVPGVGRPRTTPHRETIEDLRLQGRQLSSHTHSLLADMTAQVQELLILPSGEVRLRVGHQPPGPSKVEAANTGASPQAHESG